MHENTRVYSNNDLISASLALRINHRSPGFGSDIFVRLSLTFSGRFLDSFSHTIFVDKAKTVRNAARDDGVRIVGHRKVYLLRRYPFCAPHHPLARGVSLEPPRRRRSPSATLHIAVLTGKEDFLPPSYSSLAASSFSSKASSWSPSFTSR